LKSIKDLNVIPELLEENIGELFQDMGKDFWG
jgi:hypothetical protein